MIKNYFKTAFRNLFRNRVISLINLFGLSVGMTAAVFIFLWVQNEITYDNYHPGKENIYRITNALHLSKTETWVWDNSPLPLAAAAVKNIPEINKVVMFAPNTWQAEHLFVGNKLFPEKATAWADRNWFSVFHYDFIEGSALTFMNNPYSVVITEEKAKKYFGDVPAVGQVIKLDTVNYTIAGVIKNNPLNSSFQQDVLLQMDSHLSELRARDKNADNDWGDFNYITFVQASEGASQQIMEAKLNDILNHNRKNNSDVATLVPLKDMYFENDLQNSALPHGNKKTTYIFAIMGLLLLITACINYVNLTTARASLRAKEVSVRKIIGAERAQLFFQFIAESIVVSFCCLLITLALIQLLLPMFNTITDKHFMLPLTSAPMWQILVGTLLIATVLNGVYPALLLSSFKPLNVFRGKSILKIKDGALRKALVVFQFSLSMVLIIGAVVIYKQMRYVQTTNPGYNISQVVSLQVPYRAYANMKDGQANAFFASIKHELLTQPGIEDVCTAGGEIVNVGSSSSGNADWDGRDSTFNPTIARLGVDVGYKKMFQLQLKSGRWFREGAGDYHNFIINETAEALFNMHKPTIGQRFTWGGDTGQVIGVVKDFHYKSLHDKIGPMVLLNNQGSDSYFFVKTAAGNIPTALSSISNVWARFIPKEPFSYTFLDDSFNKLYSDDIKASRLILIFCFMAVIISALGLFGLAAFTAEQRTKEIGIRKVLGASVQQVTVLLSKDFLVLVVIAILIASPLAWWGVNKWLENFAYRINLSIWIFIGSGILALLIAALSVSVQSVKAAVSNPVKALRSE